jgi:uncharacterized protein (TIGR00266 family)
VAVGQRQEGPFETDAAIEGFAAGRWPRNALVWTETLGNWTPALDVPLFQKAMAGSAGRVPPVPRGAGRSHEIDFKITGEEMQFVEIELDPGETVIAEAGAMMYMTPDIEMETRFGDGTTESKGFLDKALSAGKRIMTGESLFMTHFTAHGRGKSHVAFAAPYPGRIVPLDLAALNGDIICERDAFLCAAKGTEVGIAFNKRLGAGFLGGEGFILQRLKGDGMAFLHAGGTIVERELAAGETLRIDTGCIVAFQAHVPYDIQLVKGLKSIFFGGEGIVFATLTGPGRIWLQSLPFSRLARRVITAAAPMANKGEGGILNVAGGLGTLLGGGSD